MKKFASYLLPSLIASVLMSMYAIIDGIFIGQKIGDSGLAAINFCWPITAFLQAIGTSLGLACGIYFQILMAKKEVGQAQRIKTTVLLMLSVISIFFGLLFFLIKEPLLVLLGAKDTTLQYSLSYTKVILIGSIFQVLGMALIPMLRNSNKVKLAMIGSLSSIFTNLLLDYLFIFVWDKGLEGAAWGSVLAQVVSCCFCLFFLRKDLHGISFSKKNIKELVKISIAPMILSYSYSIIIIMTNLVCVHYGSDGAVAAYTVLSYLSYINIAISCAVGDSIQPLFSYQHELKEFNTNRKMLFKCILISFACGLVLAILMIVLKEPLGDLYHLSDLAMSFYCDAVWYFAIGSLAVSIFKVISSYFYSINLKSYANILILLEPFILTPLFLGLCCLVWELYGVWVSYIIVQCCLLILAGVLLGKSFKKFNSDVVSKTT